MQQLTELSRVLSTMMEETAVKDLAERPAKIDQFLFMILDGQIQSDQEAAKALYGEDATPSLPSYQQLKSRLKRRILKELLQVDGGIMQFDTYEKALTNCWRGWSSVQILRSKYAYRAAGEVAEFVLKKATQFEIVELQYLSADFLQLLSAHYKDDKGWKHYKGLSEKYQNVKRAEAKAKTFNQQLRLRFTTRNTREKELIEEAKRSYREIEPNLRQYDSVTLHRFGRFLQVMADMMAHDYPKAIRSCQGAIDFFEAKPFKMKGAMISFHLQKLVCHFNLKEQEEGDKTARQALNLIQTGNFNWFKIQEMRFLLAMHAEKYTSAADLLNTVTKHGKYSKLPELEQESWILYEAYIYFLAKIRQLNSEELLQKKFRLGRFLNEVPNYSKQKSGHNIAILIVQLLILLVDHRYGEAIDRIEAIEKYCGRYLRSKGSLRSYYFIKMLLQIPISGFHKNGVERKAKSYYNKLLKVPILESNRAHQTEIIPYEKLWKFLLEALEKRFYWSDRNQKPRRKNLSA